MSIYIIVVEHDLSVLDYLSDFICCLYGVPSAYGMVIMPFSGSTSSWTDTCPRRTCGTGRSSLSSRWLKLAPRRSMKKSMGYFSLTHLQNGEVPILNVSCKPEKISPKCKHLRLIQPMSSAIGVTALLIGSRVPCRCRTCLEVSFSRCLRPCAQGSRPTDIKWCGGFLPCSFLGAVHFLLKYIQNCNEIHRHNEYQCRINVFVSDRFIFHAKTTAFIVTHDFITAAYMVDIVFDGIPSKSMTARMEHKSHIPLSRAQRLLAGMNKFLPYFENTFRRDPNNFRPRINKLNY
ncbi:hypothetical protein Z043_111624 [Scleropages formosus]|uniref:Uncharacterized protein n=1 Tax=Scleropages formosus TaxID=113540 RepID=A0A0P7WZG8_SCLFO|nr:hypothetical protein Z043_111624 [Scleropages formosus]